jgi:AraC-like DNA-binding protein
MTNPNEIIPGVLFYSYLSKMRKEKVAFIDHCILVLQVSGHFRLETASETVSMSAGQILLIRRNQLGEITKMPVETQDYQTVVICLEEALLRKIALEEKIEPDHKYTGPANILIPQNDFLQGFFQSVMPYIQHPEQKATKTLGLLKVKEAVQLLLYTDPSLKAFLFDFSEPHKIDLEKFMRSNFQYNIPLEQFARLTGRSMAGFKRDFQKIFAMAPRAWLQETQLMEAKHQIEHKNKKPTAIYLDLGFESLSHFSHSFKKKFGRAPTEYAV